ncbi:MAG TPA: VWA domain-containing protein [Pyrinomonadaceae bacterium]|nr:VWA domain-containing protein [Pyrinomonadaceae bacterium]
MAPAKSHKTRKRAGGLTNFALVLLVLFFCAALNAEGQSGRRQEPGKAKPPTGPIADPSRPGASIKTTTKSATDEVDPNDIVRISSNLVPIPASVIDKRGNAVINLKLDDFELRVDGEPRPLSDLTRSETSVRLAMLFDNSGSLDAAREFEKQAAIRFFRKVLRAADEAAIYSIETDSYLAQPLTKDVGRLEQTIAMFGKPEGGTSLFDAIVGAASYLRPYSGRRVLVIVSDGIETTSHISDFDSVVQHVLADDCQIYVVQTGLYEGANLRALAAERRMEQLSGQTGGAVYLPKTTAQLDVAFDQIAADLAQQYVLSYYPSAEHRDGRLHNLELRIKSRNDVRVRSRKGYYAPKPAPSAGY